MDTRWQRFSKFVRSAPVLVAAGLFAAYLLAGFFLVDPLARKLLPWAGERFLASRLQAQQVEFNPLTLELRVRGLALAETNGEPLAGIERLYLNFDVDGVARWAWRIQTVDIERPHARIAVRRGGALNWGALAAKLREDAGPPSDHLARVLVDHIRIADGDILYTDADRPGEPFKASFKPLGIALDAISTLPEDRGEYLIAARLPEQGATLRWKGDIALNPLVSQGEVALDGARVGRLLHAIEHRLTAEPSGTLAAAFRYRFAMLRSPSQADVPSLVVSGASVQVRDFALAPKGGGAALLQLAEARISDAAFDLVRRDIVIGALHLDRGKVAASRDAGGVLDWQALLAAAPAGNGAVADPAPAIASAPWKFAVRDLRLTGWSGRFSDHAYATPLSADAEAFELTAAIAGELGAAPILHVGPVNAAAGPVRLASGTETVAQLQRAVLTNARLLVPENQVRIDAIALAGARTAIARDKEQRINWVEILRLAAAPPPAAAPGATLPDLRVARISVDDIQLNVSDAAAPSPVVLGLTGGRLVLADVGLDPNQAIPLEAAFSVQQGGRFEAKGSLTPGKGSGRFDLKLAGLALSPFAPYVNQYARLKLQSGSAGMRGKLAFAPAKAGVGLDFNGGFEVDELAITEEDTGAAFLGWKKLSSDSVRVTLGPDRVHIGEVVAVNPQVKVIIFEDQTLNLTRMLRAQAQAQAPAPALAGTPAEFPMAIERLRVVGANAEFADLSLTPRFGTAMHELSGVVTGLSSDPSANAQVELDGKVDEFGSARIRGAIQPFRPAEATDLGLAFRNLEMTRLTPYSGKFAGRRIESGRLSVDLQYKVNARQLAGANKFVITRLRLGEPVDSPGAMKLPLDLAIALLEDSNGVIDLDLPVSGSLDDPQFSYGAIIWKAIANVLTKLVTAPFRALGAALGMNTDKLEAVGFDPGSSALLPPEQEKLKLLAEALAKRPALTVTIEPGYDPAADKRALQEAAMRREAAAVAGVALKAGEDPGPVDVNNYKVQTWLEDRYVERAGKPEYQQLRAGFQDKDAGAVARVLQAETLERLGRRFKARDTGPASAFHAELLERLTRQVAVADEALVALAQARAQAMREAVVKLGLDASRVAVAAPAKHALKDKQVASALALGAVPSAPGQPRLAVGVAPALGEDALGARARR